MNIHDSVAVWLCMCVWLYPKPWVEDKATCVWLDGKDTRVWLYTLPCLFGITIQEQGMHEFSH